MHKESANTELMEAELPWLEGGEGDGTWDTPSPHLLLPCTDPGSLDLCRIPFESGLEIPSLFRGKQMLMYFILETCSRTHNQ